jgi:hypothetical protein
VMFGLAGGCVCRGEVCGGDVCSGDPDATDVRVRHDRWRALRRGLPPPPAVRAAGPTHDRAGDVRCCRLRRAARPRLVVGRSDGARPGHAAGRGNPGEGPDGGRRSLRRSHRAGAASGTSLGGRGAAASTGCASSVARSGARDRTQDALGRLRGGRPDTSGTRLGMAAGSRHGGSSPWRTRTRPSARTSRSSGRPSPKRR